MWETVEQLISSAIGRRFHIEATNPVAGGCIHNAYRINGEGKSYFVKANRPEFVWMFETEASALDEIIATKTVRVPNPVCWGSTEDSSFLVLEWLFLDTHNPTCDRILGCQLAEMHRRARPYFGWWRDNAIGSTTQTNTSNQEWVEFWLTQRLGFQLDLAENNGYSGNIQRAGQKLKGALHGFFSDYQPRPSLLHGDLWGGNFAMDESGSPVIFDPATYYGDREAEIAMTELFGGFGTEFYAAYNDSFPLDPGYSTRKTLYNLYHILNHLNLFGGGYLMQAQSMIDSLLAELK